MEFAFPWPMSQGEWLAWSVAAFTIALGLLSLVAPRVSLRIRGLQPAVEAAAHGGNLRGTLSGFPLGVGLSCMLLAQPMIYIALGASWLFTAVGHAVSLATGRGKLALGLSWLAIELALGLLPLAYVFGFMP